MKKSQSAPQPTELSDYVNELIEQSRADDERPVDEPRTDFLKKIRGMTVAELVANFSLLSSRQNDEAIPSSKRKALYARTDAIERELISRDGDQRSALTGLLGDPDPGIRCRAAAATFALDRDRASKVLEQIAEHEDFPASAQAFTFLAGVRAGRFTPK